MALMTNILDHQELTRLRLDLKRRFLKYPHKSTLGKMYYYYSNIQYRTLFYFRVSKIFKNIPIINLLSKLIYEKSSIKSGIEILCPLGGGVIIPHFGDIKLNAKSIGNNLYIFHNVTIGNDYKTGIPTLGNDIFIGTNVVILGEIKIGNNVMIGANSFVIDDIPSNSLVTGNPAKVVKKINKDYLKKILTY